MQRRTVESAKRTGQGQACYASGQRNCWCDTGPPAAVKCCPEGTTLWQKVQIRDKPDYCREVLPRPNDVLLKLLQRQKHDQAVTEKGIEHNVACSRNLHCLNSLWFVTKCVPSIDTYLIWRWRNVSLAVRHFLACSYNLCSLLSVCDVIGLFLAQARPTDDYHLPSYWGEPERAPLWRGV